MPTQLGESDWQEIDALLAEARLIEAIKRYREQTGAGLAEAKAAVEQRQQGLVLSGQARTEDWASIDDALARGNKIEAIKLHRSMTGLGLAESKTAVEARESELRASGRLIPQAKSGCMGVLLLSVALIAPAIWLILNIME